MGRKKALKKKFGSRSEMYKILRESDTKESIVLKNGSAVALNPLKHLLFNERYKNDEKNKYLADIVKQYKAFIEQRIKEEKAAAEPTYEVLENEEEKQNS